MSSDPEDDHPSTWFSDEPEQAGDWHPNVAAEAQEDSIEAAIQASTATHTPASALPAGSILAQLQRQNNADLGVQPGLGGDIDLRKARALLDSKPSPEVAILSGMRMSQSEVKSSPQDTHSEGLSVPSNFAPESSGTVEQVPESNEDDQSNQDEDEQDEEDEEEEEQEPKLKYQRLSSRLTAMLADPNGDRVRCLAAHEKFIVIGTQRGVIHQLDLNGNEILRVDCHPGPVIDVAIDGVGDYVATCSTDGTVVITDLYTKGQTRVSYPRPVLSVALPASYKQSQMFAAGGLAQQLVINTKGWFGPKDQVMHQGEGPIYSIQWSGDLLAWSNDVGVKVIDPTIPERIAYVAKATSSLPHGLARCNLSWGRADTLYMAWADEIKIGQIKCKHKVEKGQKLPGNRYMQIIALFSTSYIVCGVAPLNEHIVMLAYSEDYEDEEDEEGKPNPTPLAQRRKIVQQPELRIVTQACKEIASDTLPVNGYESLKPSDYRLVYLPGNYESLLYIVSPRDVIRARPRDMDDHIRWLLHRHKYREALDAALVNAPLIPQQRIAEVSQAYLEYLFRNYDYIACAQSCGKLLHDAAAWEAWISKFEEAGKLLVLTTHIPYTKITLNKATYTRVLTNITEQAQAPSAPGNKPLRTNDLSSLTGAEIEKVLKAAEAARRLLALVRTWPSSSYDIPEVTEVVASVLRKQQVDPLSSRTSDISANEVDESPVFLDDVSDTIARRVGVSASNNVATSLQSRAQQSHLQPLTEHLILLLEAYGELLLKNQKPESALLVYLEAGRADVFDMIRDLELIDCVKDRIFKLALFRPLATVALCLDSLDRLPPEYVVPQLRRRPHLVQIYLHACFRHDPALVTSYVSEMPALYARYAPDHLMYFLTNCTKYRLEDALRVCEQYGLFNEQVYLLRYMGNMNQALTIIVDKLEDVGKALRFVEETNDPSLWDSLVSRALSSPMFLSALLEQAGAYNVNMAGLIAQIPDEMNIPYLRQRLIQVLLDCNNQTAISSACASMLRTDLLRLHRKYVREASKGARVDPKRQCHSCGNLISLPASLAGSEASSSSVGRLPSSGSLGRGRGSLILFACGHAYHQECHEAKVQDALHLQSQGQSSRSNNLAEMPIMRTCLQCTSQRRLTVVPNLRTQRHATTTGSATTSSDAGATGTPAATGLNPPHIAKQSIEDAPIAPPIRRRTSMVPTMTRL